MGWIVEKNLYRRKSFDPKPDTAANYNFFVKVSEWICKGSFL